MGMVALVLIGATACGQTPSPGATITAPQTSGAADRLSTVLVQPPGFVGIPNDPLTGPIGHAEVGKIFVDHPGDATEILSQGFVGGYYRGWQQPTATSVPGPTTIPDTTTVTGIVLQFGTEEQARAVAAYFRKQNTEDGYELFTVPTRLAEGYGVQEGPDNLGVYLFGVLWVHGTYVFNVVLQSTDPATTASQVTALAEAQEGALT